MWLKSSVHSTKKAKPSHVSEEPTCGATGISASSTSSASPLRRAADVQPQVPLSASLPNTVEEEITESFGEPPLGPLVAAMMAQKLEQILRDEGPAWDASCRAFGRLQSQEENAQDAYVHDKAKVHGEFLARLENYFDDVCRQLHIRSADVAQLLQKEAARNKDAKLIIDRLLRYTDYQSFAELMHKHYWSTVKEVRLFWDIENIGWEDMQQSGREVVKGLRDFLDARNISGFSAQMWAVAPTWRFADCPKVVDDLEDAAIRAVNCKSKPEAADHVIKAEIDKAALLYAKYQVPANSVVFIVITSDQDFTDVLQKLQHGGYKTVLIHNAREGSRHVDMMSLYASHAFSWKEILPVGLTTRKTGSGAPAARKSEKSEWQRLVDWARGKVHPPVWVNGTEDSQAHVWRTSLQFGRGRFPNEIPLSQGETRTSAARTALDTLAQLLGEHAEATNIEQRALHTALSAAQGM